MQCANEMQRLIAYHLHIFYSMTGISDVLVANMRMNTAIA